MSIDENVLSFDISMDDISLMQIQKHLGNDQKKLFGLMFCQSVLWFRQEIVVEGVGSSVLQNEVELGLGFNYVGQFGYGVVG